MLTLLACYLLPNHTRFRVFSDGRCYFTWLVQFRLVLVVVCQTRGLRQTHTDVVEEVRPRKHEYVCSEERAVMRHAVLT